MLSGSVQPDKVCLLGSAELGDLPRSRPLALASFMPSLVLILMRSDSNSAVMARTLNSSRPIGSFGSWTDPPMLSFTSAAVRPSRCAVRS